MLLRSFCLLCSLLDILIHHIWVHFLKSTLFQVSPNLHQVLCNAWTLVFLGNKVLLSQMVECLSDLALAKSAGGGWPVSYYQYRPLASMVLPIQATGQYGITNTGHWPVWY